MDRRDVTVIAPLPLEASVIRRECPELRVVETGVALANTDASQLGDTVISYGLAGGLTRSLPTGTVLIPREVERPDGTRLTCDHALQRALTESARRLGYDLNEAPMITSATLVGGNDRARLAARGFAGVDMESGLLTAPRVAVVRVILDTPNRELSAAWLHPAKALMNPTLWPQGFWLGRNAPRCARAAAQIIGGAFPLSS
jgi:nucleoside phosphorylase